MQYMETKKYLKKNLMNIVYSIHNRVKINF